MNKLMLITIFLFFYSNVNGQFIEKLYLDLDVARYTKIHLLKGSRFPPKEFTFANGVKLGFKPSEKWSHYIGFRKINGSLNYGGGFSAMDSHYSGGEFTIGTHFTPFNKNRLSASVGLELFGEFSNFEGIYKVDYGPHFKYEINHSRSFVGLAPHITFNFKISDNLYLYANMRYRVGYVIMEQKESEMPETELWPGRKYWYDYLDPLNSFGLRFQFCK